LAESRQNGTFRNTPFLRLEQKTHPLPPRQGRKTAGRRGKAIRGGRCGTGGGRGWRTVRGKNQNFTDPRKKPGRADKSAASRLFQLL